MTRRAFLFLPLVLFRPRRGVVRSWFTPCGRFETVTVERR